MIKLNSIMLVDDDDTTNFINGLLIDEMGIANELLIASNGQEALDKIMNQCMKNDYCPDLILLDINMPVMDGFDFLEKFNELNIEKKHSTIVVMLTTSLNPTDIKKAGELNVKDYINKPLIEAGLKNILDKHFVGR